MTLSLVLLPWTTFGRYNPLQYWEHPSRPLVLGLGFCPSHLAIKLALVKVTLILMLGYLSCFQHIDIKN